MSSIFPAQAVFIALLISSKPASFNIYPSAPFLIPVNMYSSSLKVVNIIILIWLNFSLIILVASTPLIIGILISIRITSGYIFFFRSSIRSCPLSTSPITFISLSKLKIIFKPSRTIFWSSAIITFIIFCFLSLIFYNLSWF